jgi:DNA-binding GntR family transcriptional regulator
MSSLDSRARRPADAPARAIPLRDRAYAEIKRRINCLAYAPGAYINEAQVSRELKLGRTPVHHALDRLRLEGLVSVIPRKGVIVQAVSLDTILQIIDLRHLNEPYGVALAVERGTAQDIHAMRQILHEAPALIRVRNREALMNLDRAFHHAIAQAARHPILGELLSALHERSLRFWFISLGDDLQLRRVNDEHHAVLDAIAARDKDAATGAMRAHIDSFRSNIMRTI